MLPREGYQLPQAKLREEVGTFATNIIEERQPNGVVNKLFLHGPQADEHLMYFNASTGGLYFYYADETNSTSLLLDPAGTPVEFYTYDVYGAPSVVQSIVDNPFMFTGREWDSETGTYYYRARQYSPLLGRFLQRDPIGYFDSMNLYTYVGNSPNNFVDPSGKNEVIIAAIVGGFIITTVITIMISIKPRLNNLKELQKKQSKAIKCGNLDLALELEEKINDEREILIKQVRISSELLQTTSAVGDTADQAVFIGEEIINKAQNK